jgi:hypothetical protein
LRTTIQIGTKGRSDAAQMIKRIEAMGNITLSKSGLHPAELHAQFADAAVIVLPYDVRRYKGRGSALMWGALDHGIPLIAPAGTGFGDDIARHGIGVTYKHQREIAALVQQILEAPQQFTDAITRYQAHRAVAVHKFFNK